MKFAISFARNTLRYENTEIIKQLTVNSNCVLYAIKYAIRAKHKMYLAKIETSLKDNPKMFWKYHKSILHHHSSLNPIITFNNCTAKSPKEKAELFNTYFCSVFRTAQTAMNPDASISSMTSSSQLSDITISEKEVLRIYVT